MKKIITLCLLAVTGCFTSLHAQYKVYSVDLSGPNEFPTNTSPGTGIATITVDTVLFTMRVECTFSGLTGTTSASHIHAPTAQPNTGTAGVATTTPTFTGFPTGVTSGTYDHTFDMTLNSSYNASFVTASGGTTALAFKRLVTAMDATKAYLNIHSSTFPGGEIRGFLVPVTCSPTSSNTNITICNSLLPYDWNGLTFNAAGSQTAHLTNAGGCDSAATLNLTVLSSLPAITGVSSVCNGSQTTFSNTQSGGAWSSNNSGLTINATTGLATGKANGASAAIKYLYTAGGCNLSVTKNVTVVAKPSAPSIAYAAGTVNPQYGPGGTFCNNKTFTVVGNPSGGVWSSGNTGVLTVGSSSGVVNTVGTGSGSLTYTVTNSGCSNSRTIAGTVENCAFRGTNQSSNQLFGQEFTLYPNPARSFMTLKVNSLIGNGSIVITDLYGKQIKQQILSMGNNTIDVTRLAKGMYLVNIITIDGMKTQKLMVE